MQNEWQPVYFTDKAHLIEIVKALLSESDIESYAVNRRDSTNMTDGDIELYVKNKDVVMAKFLIEKNNL